MEKLYADIIINISHEALDKVFAYKVPFSMIKDIRVGQQVVVPFGRSNKEQTGYVVNQRSGMAHHADCMYAAQISDENRVYFTESELDAALTEADTLCSRCFAQMTAMAE